MVRTAAPFARVTGSTIAGSVLSRTTFSGVWLSNYPLECNEGAKGDQLLEITLPDDLDISDHEWAEEGKPYREWLVPAEVINQHGKVRLLSADEEDQIDLWY
jgi:hypothetical protein